MADAGGYAARAAPRNEKGRQAGALRNANERAPPVVKQRQTKGYRYVVCTRSGVTRANQQLVTARQINHAAGKRKRRAAVTRRAAVRRATNGTRVRSINRNNARSAYARTTRNVTATLCCCGERKNITAELKSQRAGKPKCCARQNAKGE